MSDLESSCILINGRIWATSNLDVSTFRNGDPIPKVKTNEEWFVAGYNKQPAWCWVSNDPKERKKYGKLYNHYAVADPRGLAPQGWRIPSKNELGSLIINRQLTDEIDLSVAGYRHSDVGLHFDVGSAGYYWSSSVDDIHAMNARSLYFDGRYDEVGSNYRADGCSVRCLKKVIMNDLVSSGNLINKKIWSTSNLDVSKFSNGDPIPEAKTDEQWIEAGVNEQPAWCWASNDPVERKKYGKFYNHFAVADPRDLAPKGWRIPNEDELEEFIVAGLTDELNLPLAGYRDLADCMLYGVDSFGYYWSSSFDGPYAKNLFFSNSNAFIFSLFRSYGFSVRCFKD